ncbi:THAP domain-containing protein 9 [Plakobranchus ocellatus]|uniref:THAP domain-containing protein 9 n=1 Tax=Plakobranchus ocellatus TaxID=259542 RepID=A0AAV3YS19_9GAST|nr:THAP domain-containing protein 9 [Plakobranchus ocellatus]
MFSLSKFTVRNIVYTWIKFCAFQWQEVNIWPEKNSVDVYCPKDFKRKYRNTRVILDGTEIPISKPKNPTAQRASFSTYKHQNTVKVLIGAIPGGQVSYVSEAYGGAASDKLWKDLT